MNGVELAALINQRAEESRARDGEILVVVHQLETKSALHSQRLDGLEKRLDKASDRWAEDTGRFHTVELTRAEKTAADLQESKRHWVRWVVRTLAAIAIAAGGAGIGFLIGG